jgi:hypothetical protein
MKTIAFFLEEYSARVFLEGLINTHFAYDPEKLSIQYKVFEGKQDLDKNLKKRLQYWQTPNTTFFVMRDKDSGDCVVIKNGLLKKCNDAGRPDSIVRIACHELESFYLGDLLAVEKGLEQKNLEKLQNKARYREPDNLENPSRVLGQLTKNAYQKIDGSRKIAPFMTPGVNKSHSFKVLYKSIERIIKDAS